MRHSILHTFSQSFLPMFLSFVSKKWRLRRSNGRGWRCCGLRQFENISLQTPVHHFLAGCVWHQVKHKRNEDAGGTRDAPRPAWGAPWWEEARTPVGSRWRWRWAELGALSGSRMVGEGILKGQASKGMSLRPLSVGSAKPLWQLCLHALDYFRGLLSLSTHLPLPFLLLSLALTLRQPVGLL